MSRPAEVIHGGLKERLAAVHDCTEDGVAQLFTAEIADAWRFDTVNRRWMRFDNDAQAWRADSADLLLHQVAKFVRDTYYAPTERMRRVTFDRAVLQKTKVDPRIAFDGSRWDEEPHLLGTPRGTFDLRTGQRLADNARADVTRLSAVAPSDEGVRPVRFEQLLDETFDGDRDTISFVQRWAGYCATGEIKEHRFLWAQGAGGAGSSTLLDAVAFPIGDYATAATVEAFATVKGERHPTEIAALAGARLVMVSEFPRGRPADETRIKAWTAGDLHSARQIRGNPFNFRPVGKLWVTSNSPPSFASVDAAIRRRLILLPLTRRVVTPDHDLPQKLRAEAPAILRWILEGARTYYADGLRIPEKLTAVAHSYFEEEDTIGVFLQECCKLGPDEKTSTGDLYGAWRKWCRARNEPEGTHRTFSESIRQRGFIARRTGRERRFLGLSVLSGDGGRDGCDAYDAPL